jgi:hypothetical protein
MAARVHNVFSLAEILKIFLSETTNQSEHIMGPGSHVGFPISTKNKILVYDHPIGPYGNFTFSSFFLKPQNRFESNLAEMFIGWSYTRGSYVKLSRVMAAILNFRSANDSQV